MAIDARRRRTFALVTFLGGTLALLALAEVALRLFWGGFYMDEGSLRGRRSALLVWENRPGIRFTVGRPEFHHEATHDSNGFRTLAGETPREKPAGKTRVLCVGDSFTWGYGVGDLEAFPERMEALEPRIDGINAGCMGYGTAQEVLLLRERGLAFSPDVVVLTFFWNDLSDVQGAPVGFSVDAEGRLVEAPRDPSATALPALPASVGGERDETGDRWESRSLVTRALRHSYLYRYTKDAAKMVKFSIDTARGEGTGDPVMTDPAKIEASWRLVRALFAEAKRLCDARGVKLLVAAVPDQKIVHPDWPVYGLNDAMLGAAGRAVETASSLGIPALDLTPGLVAAGKAPGAKLFYPRDRHLTPSGHDVAARMILAELRRLGWVPAAN